jgi:hypothetical protein
VPAAPLTRCISEGKRSLHAVLDRLLGDARLSFPAWIVLVTVDASDTIGVGDLTEVLLEAHVIEYGPCESGSGSSGGRTVVRQAHDSLPWDPE